MRSSVTLDVVLGNRGRRDRGGLQPRSRKLPSTRIEKSHSFSLSYCCRSFLIESRNSSSVAHGENDIDVKLGAKEKKLEKKNLKTVDHAF
jgi:hypothetical protein